MLFFKAEQIHLITGAKIKVTITNGDTGKTVKYDSSNTLIRNAAIQCGKSSLPARELNRIQNTVNTPKKVTRSRATIDKNVVQNLPGKKKTPPVKPQKKLLENVSCAQSYTSLLKKGFPKKEDPSNHLDWVRETWMPILGPRLLYQGNIQTGKES